MPISRKARRNANLAQSKLSGGPDPGRNKQSTHVGMFVTRRKERLPVQVSRKAQRTTEERRSWRWRWIPGVSTPGYLRLSRSEKDPMLRCGAATARRTTTRWPSIVATRHGDNIAGQYF